MMPRLDDPLGLLSKPISVHKGIKQRCILAPLLFNLHMHALAIELSDPNFHPLELHISMFHYYFMQMMQLLFLDLQLTLGMLLTS